LRAPRPPFPVPLKNPSNFDPSRFPRRLNLGCGSDYRDGYLNIDLNAWYRCDLVADIRKLDFLPSQYYEELVAQDVLEHLPRTDTLRTLANWNRVVRTGGTLMVRVPSILGIAKLLEKPENQSPQIQEELIQALFGTQAYTGDFHFTSFTEVLLEHYLAAAGFTLRKIDLLHGSFFDAWGEKTSHVLSPLPLDHEKLLAIGDDEAFIRACYLEVLQREADPGGLAFYLDGLRGGGMKRQVVIDSMLGGPEYRALQGRG